MPTARRGGLPRHSRTTTIDTVKNNLRTTKGQTLKTLAALLMLHASIPTAKAQLVTVYDCSNAGYGTALEICLQSRAIAIRANRDYCLAQIGRARSLQAAGRLNAWGDVPSACLY